MISKHYVEHTMRLNYLCPIIFKRACYISLINNTICDCYYYNFTTIKPLYHYYRRRASIRRLNAFLRVDYH